MKTIGGKSPSAYLGYHAVCQFCGQHVVFEEGDVKVAEAGDFKDEAKLRWKCPTCKQGTTTTLSRMKQNHRSIYDKRH